MNKMRAGCVNFERLGRVAMNKDWNESAELAAKLLKALGIEWHIKYEGEDEGIIFCLKEGDGSFAGIFPPEENGKGWVPYTIGYDGGPYEDPPDYFVNEEDEKSSLVEAILEIIRIFMLETMVSISEQEMADEWGAQAEYWDKKWQDSQDYMARLEIEREEG